MLLDIGVERRVTTLGFVVESNCDTPYVNYAKFKYRGREMLVDRWETDYSYLPKQNILEMEWILPHEWYKEQMLPLPDDFYEAAEFIGFVVEDDAPEGYYIENGEKENDYA